MKVKKYKIRFKIPKQIYDLMQEDLRREHLFAYERVGFLFTTSKLINGDTILVLAKDYLPVEDDDYIEDNTVGAKINSSAIRKAMQRLLDKKEGCFHVHLHDHKGTPSPSLTDKKGLSGVVDSFCNVSSKQTNGYLILSESSFYVSAKLGHKIDFDLTQQISVVGYPLNLVYPQAGKSSTRKSLDRQSFLGESFQRTFLNINVGIIGYGGGGSHIGQQLAHLGIENIFVFDNDKVEETNLNRLIGAKFTDAKNSVLKTNVAKRLISAVLPTSKVKTVNTRWQKNPELVQTCDVVFGCVDSYIERQQLEAECRRFLIPYIDIGMDVFQGEDKNYSMAGQVILSMPGGPCMNCMRFLSDEKLSMEAAKYGAAGGRPQVVWANGVLASTAVGIFVDLVTGWTKERDRQFYYEFDGNSGVLKEHIRLKFTNKSCPHYLFENLGVPVYKSL